MVREQRNELFADALRPLNGMDRQQYAVHSRRVHLPPQIKIQCRVLDAEIPLLEKEGRQAGGRNVQRSLFESRQRFRKLRC